MADGLPAGFTIDQASPAQAGGDLPQGFKVDEAPQTWGQTATSALSNIPSSAAKFAHDIVQPILHPIDTAVAIKNIGHGALEKAGVLSGDEHKKYADAVGEFFADRYGGIDNLKKTIATDPVGLAADISTILSGGSTLAARAPATMGRVAEVANTAARITDPLTAVTGTVKKVGEGAAHVIGDLGTHTGAAPLKEAARAGFEGGTTGQTFLENMRGKAHMEDAVNEARSALGAIREERGNVYREGMKDIASDPTVLDFDKIDRAVAKAQNIKNYKGQNLSPTTTKVRGEMESAIENWRNLDPAEFHTAEGLDALKQQIGDIRDATQPGTPERVAANQVYNAVRQTVIDQAPQYAKVMKGYEEASKQIKDIEKTLSLNPNASIDTSLRKLQSVLRNNVNTNYGRRAELADFLVKAGAPNLMTKLAGQALNSWTARGLGKLGTQLGLEMAAMGIGAGAAGAPGALAAAATLPFMSPRLMGEAAYGAGAVARGLNKLPINVGSKPALQTGRIAPLGHGPFEFPQLQGPIPVRAQDEQQ